MQNAPTSLIKGIFELINQLFQQIQIMIQKIECLLADIENTGRLINDSKEVDQIQSQNLNTFNFIDIFKAPQLDEEKKIIIRCSVCRIKTEDITELVEHIQKKHKDKLITDIINSSQVLSKNLQDLNDVDDETNNKISCKICGKILKHKYGLLIHQKLQHNLRIKTLRIPIQTVQSRYRMFQINKESIQQK